MTKDQQTNARLGKWAIAGLIISWLTFGTIILSPFGLIAWFVILVFLIVKKYKIKWYIIFSAWIVVPICSFFIGTILYFNAEAYINEGHGGCETFHGIDEDTRVISNSGGRVFWGFEPFVYPTNNLAVRLCTILFGYEEGAYTGVFPSESEAKEIIKSAPSIKVKYGNGYMQFESKEITVKLDILAFYEYDCYENFGSYNSKINRTDSVCGKVINNECFVFQNLDTTHDFTTDHIFLVDIDKNKLLKVYDQY